MSENSLFYTANVIFIYGFAILKWLFFLWRKSFKNGLRRKHRVYYLQQLRK